MTSFSQNFQKMSKASFLILANVICVKFHQNRLQKTDTQMHIQASSPVLTYSVMKWLNIKTTTEIWLGIISGDFCKIRLHLYIFYLYVLILIWFFFSFRNWGWLPMKNCKIIERSIWVSSREWVTKREKTFCVRRRTRERPKQSALSKGYIAFFVIQVSSSLIWESHDRFSKPYWKENQTFHESWSTSHFFHHTGNEIKQFAIFSTAVFNLKIISNSLTSSTKLPKAYLNVFILCGSCKAIILWRHFGLSMFMEMKNHYHAESEKMQFPSGPCLSVSGSTIIISLLISRNSKLIWLLSKSRKNS